MSVLPVSKLQLGIICRFKASADAESTEGFGHVDAILPLGAPIGFFAKSGGLLELIFHADSVVRDYSLLASSRPEYVDVKSAKAKPCVSTAYIIDVTLAESLAFESYWAYLRTKQPRYAAAGANCATYAAEALEHAKIMKGGIDGLDTPDNLFKALTKARPGGKVHSGYFGFTPAGGAAFRVECH